MLRAFPAIASLLLVAGCLALPESEDTLEPAATPPADVERIEGMTMAETRTDAIVDCDQDPGLLSPPATCAERTVVAEGRIGVEHLPVELLGSNGEIRIVFSEADASDTWSFEATIRVRAMNEEMARDALDSAWTWSHEKGGAHAIFAGPTMTTGMNVMGFAPTLESTAYTLKLPSWVTLDLKALSNNGGIATDAFTFGTIDVETDNGQIILQGSAVDVRGRTDNGGINAYLTPVGTGSWDLTTDNGQVVLSVPEDRAHGYDIQGKTDNGQIVIDLRDGDVSRTEDGTTFRTNGFDSRSIRTTMKLESDNGQIVVDGK